jgi:hypothetical protein
LLVALLVTFSHVTSPLAEDPAALGPAAAAAAPNSKGVRRNALVRSEGAKADAHAGADSASNDRETVVEDAAEPSSSSSSSSVGGEGQKTGGILLEEEALQRVKEHEIEKQQVKVPLSPGRDGASVMVAADLDVEYADRVRFTDNTPTWGFYIHMVGEKVAVTHQLRQVRKFYPEAPVYIMSDGGVNVSGICSNVGNCKFAWRAGAHDCWNPKPFLDRFREAALWLQSRHAEWTIMLEPDVTLWQRATYPVKADAGGLRDAWNGPLSQGLLDHITQLGRTFSGKKDFKLPWTRFGMAGGCVVRTQAAVIAFKPDYIDWPLMEKLGSVQIYSSDIAMPIALAAHGYAWYPWEDVKEGKDESQPNHSVAFEHHRKYADPLTAEELLLVADGPENRRGMDMGECQHCMWVNEEECWPKPGEKNIIKCPTDVVNFRKKHWPIEPPRPELFPAALLQQDWEEADAYYAGTTTAAASEGGTGTTTMGGTTKAAKSAAGSVSLAMSVASVVAAAAVLSCAV